MLTNNPVMAAGNAPRITQMRETITTLVSLCDQLRQPLNNTRYHDLYLKACETLNDLEERGLIQ
jgi:hypothetical protein